ncbi:hypothetical protein ACOSQ2_027152 [Xanthoceras sorbifolium]
MRRPGHATKKPSGHRQQGKRHGPGAANCGLERELKTLSSRRPQSSTTMFQVLKRYQMKINPLKCAFGVASGKFLSFMVNQRGIEANPKKIKALREMKSPAKPKHI